MWRLTGGRSRSCAVKSVHSLSTDTLNDSSRPQRPYEPTSAPRGLCSPFFLPPLGSRDGKGKMMHVVRQRKRPPRSPAHNRQDTMVGVGVDNLRPRARKNLIIRKFGRARRVTSWWSSGALRAAASLVVLSLGFPTHPLASSEVEYQRSGVRSTSRRRHSDDQKVSVAAEQNPKIMIKSLCQRPSSAQEGWPTLLERTGKLLLLAAER